jgi:hypothetical protein
MLLERRGVINSADYVRSITYRGDTTSVVISVD